MTKTIGLGLALALSVPMLSACAPQTRFEWGTYEPSLYAYYKNPSAQAEYENALVKAIAAGKKSNKIAPGLYAELGYLKLEEGKIAEAQANFDEEMRLFPESRFFLANVSRRAAPGAAKGPTS
jgi:hypothetical protein